jgi:cytochrome c peroxidase
VGVALGRRLFFDPILSKDSTISCGSCHHPAQAFADSGKKLSRGIHQQLTKRNASGLFNLLWQREFFADGGVRHFELIPLAPLVNRQEMQGDLKELLDRLRQNASYTKDFQKVFKTDSLQSKHIFYALAQFMGSLISANSRYDGSVQGKVRFTKLEKLGLTVFKQKCGDCHQMSNQLFTDLSYRNIGLDSVSSDLGRYLITEQTTDKGKFKVPSLRNVMLTPPYMHDGRFDNIDQVLQHYAQGVKRTANLDKSLINSSDKVGILLSNQEKEALKAFLLTLTDSTFIKKHAR